MNQHKNLPEDLAALTRLGGLDRVKASLCEVELLMPDETGRIFEKVGEYTQWMQTAGYKAPKSRRQMQREALLGVFLENGDRGYEAGMVFLTELLALPLLPVTLVLYSLHGATLFVGEQIWHRLLVCAESAATPEALRKVCVAMVELTDDSSAWAEYINSMDYTSYSLIMTVVDIVEVTANHRNSSSSSSVRHSRVAQITSFSCFCAMLLVI